MQCSSRKFVASQVYYGLRIAHPEWSADKITDVCVEEAEMLIAKLDKPKINNKGTKKQRGRNGLLQLKRRAALTSYARVM